MKYTIDGNQVCCMQYGRENLATDHAGFGDSLREAFLDYCNGRHVLPKANELYSWEHDWLLEAKENTNDTRKST